MNKFLIPVILSIIILLGITTAYADEHEENLIPSWFKGTAAWWSEGRTSDDEMISALEMLIDSNIININDLDCEELVEEIEKLIEEKAELVEQITELVEEKADFVEEITQLVEKVTEWTDKYNDAESRIVAQAIQDANAHKTLYDEMETDSNNKYDTMVENLNNDHDDEITEYTDIIHLRDAEIEDLKRQLNER